MKRIIFVLCTLVLVAACRNTKSEQQKEADRQYIMTVILSEMDNTLQLGAPSQWILLEEPIQSARHFTGNSTLIGGEKAIHRGDSVIICNYLFVVPGLENIDLDSINFFQNTSDDAEAVKANGKVVPRGNGWLVHWQGDGEPKFIAPIINWHYAGKIAVTGRDSAVVYRGGEVLNIVSENYLYDSEEDVDSLSLAWNEKQKPVLKSISGVIVPHLPSTGDIRLRTIRQGGFVGDFDIVQSANGAMRGTTYKIGSHSFWLDHSVNVLDDPTLLDGELPAQFRLGGVGNLTYTEELDFSAEAAAERTQSKEMSGFEWLEAGVKLGAKVNDTAIREGLCGDARYILNPVFRWQLAKNTMLTLWGNGRGGFIRIGDVQVPMWISDCGVEGDKSGQQYRYFIYYLQREVLPNGKKAFSHVEVKFDKDTRVFKSLSLK